MPMGLHCPTSMKISPLPACCAAKKHRGRSLHDNPSARQQRPIRFSFGDSPELADRLLALVLAGKKRATCGALRDYGAGGEPMPEVGRRDVVLNGAGEEACIIETLKVETRRFDEIGPEFTDREGEGPYAEWRAGHEAYFARNGGFSPEMEIVCETFRLVEVLPAGKPVYDRVAAPVFVVTDIEADGPAPLHNSMLSFASVAIAADGTPHGEFEAVLTPRPTAGRMRAPWNGGRPSPKPGRPRPRAPRTRPWSCRAMPTGWKACRPGRVRGRADDLRRALDGSLSRSLCRHAGPLGAFSGRQIFRGGGICLYTMAGTLRGAPYLDWGMSKVPAEFYGHIPHTHRAIDDSRGYANVLVEMLKLSSALPPITGSSADFR